MASAIVGFHINAVLQISRYEIAASGIGAPHERVECSIQGDAAECIGQGPGPGLVGADKIPLQAVVGRAGLGDEYPILVIAGNQIAGGDIRAADQVPRSP